MRRYAPLTLTGPRARRTLAACSLLLAVAVLPACSGDDEQDGPAENDEVGAGSEVAAAGGALCPPSLDGLGTREPAAEPVSLPAPESATVCLFAPTETTEADATTTTWALSGDPVPVEPRDLTSLSRRIADLTPLDSAERACPADLGQRWMLVSTVGDDLTGIVIDDFGCTDLRLSDDPFDNAPGDAAQEGTGPGVFEGSAMLLNQLKRIWVDG